MQPSDASLSTTLSSSDTNRGSIIAGAEFRPTWNLGDRKWTGEHVLELGYKIGTKGMIAYRQQIDSAMTPSLDGQYFGFSDGYLMGRIYGTPNPQSGVGLTFEPRVYFPTDPAKRDHGLVTAIRSYFKVERKLTDNFSMLLWEVPILHAYSQRGFQSATPNPDGTVGLEANPLFENRVYAGPVFSWGKGFASLMTTLQLKNTRYSDFSETAKYNDDWQHELTFYSEFTVQILPNIGLGVAYESGNLIQADFSDFNMYSGFNTGRGQFILSFSL